MLLVKSRESKSLNKYKANNPFKTGGYLLFLFLIFSPLPALSQVTETSSLSNPTSILSIFLSLMLVIAIIFALAWIMRRFNVAHAGHGQMRVVASLMAGAKEKVLVIEVAGEQHLLGVTAHNINHLATLETHLDTHASKPASGQVFKDKLVHAMAQGMTPNKNKADKSGVGHE